MTGIGTIVVPLDGSASADRGVPVASRLASRLSAEVHLLSAVATAGEIDERAAHLDAIHVPGHRVYRAVVVDADPAGAIHDAVERLTGAVVCMTSRGWGRSRALVGSVAAELLHLGRDPVVLVGPRIDDFAPWIGRRVVPRGVVVYVDDPLTSREVVKLGSHWAGLLHEPLIVLSVAELVPESLDSGPTHRRFGPDGDVEASLESLAAPPRAAGLDVATVALYKPINPSGGFGDFLRERPASCVVVSSRARHDLAGRLSESAAAAVLRESPSPVLVLRQPIPSNELPAHAGSSLAASVLA